MANNLKNSEVAKLLVSHNSSLLNDHVTSNKIHSPTANRLSEYHNNKSTSLADLSANSLSTAKLDVNSFSISLARHLNDSFQQSTFNKNFFQNQFYTEFKAFTREDPFARDCYLQNRNPLPFNHSICELSPNNKGSLIDLSVKKVPKQLKNNFEMRQLLESPATTSPPCNKPSNHNKDITSSSNESNDSAGDTTPVNKTINEVNIKKEPVTECSSEKISQSQTENKGQSYVGEAPSINGFKANEHAAKNNEERREEGTPSNDLKAKNKIVSSNNSVSIKEKLKEKYSCSTNATLSHLSSSTTNYQNASLSVCSSSIIKTSPAIISLLLNKHTTAPSSTQSFYTSPSKMSSSLQTLLNPANNPLYNHGELCADQAASTVNVVSCHERHRLATCPAPDSSFASLKNILLKPSSVNVVKDNLKKPIGEAKGATLAIRKYNGKVTNGSLSDKKNKKAGEENNNHERWIKNDGAANSLYDNRPPEQTCEGSDCACGCCSKRSDDNVIDKGTEEVQNLKQEKNLIFLDKNNSDYSKINSETDKTVKSMLLLKNGYKHSAQIIFSELQKSQILDNYYKSRGFSDQNIYVYQKNNEAYDTSSSTFGKEKSSQKLWKKQSKNTTPSCCSSISNTPNHKISQGSVCSKEAQSKKKIACLSKRKFIELKNRLADVDSLHGQSTREPCCSPGDCSMSCCKRSKQASVSETTDSRQETPNNVNKLFTACQNDCNPLSCSCPGNHANCCMDACRKTDFRENDNSSISDTSTLSVNSFKNEPEDKATFKDASTQWTYDDLHPNLFHKDFSVQCNIDEGADGYVTNVIKCDLCNCCSTSKSSSFSTSPSRSSPSSSSSSAQWPDKRTNKLASESRGDGRETPPMTQEGALRCVHCGISFDDEVIFSIHMGSHSHQDAYTCNLCGKKCLNKYGFNTHILHGHHFVS